MELQWPLIIFTTLVAWSAGLFGTQALMAVFGVGKKAQVPAWVCSAVLLAAGGIAVFFLSLIHILAKEAVIPMSAPSASAPRPNPNTTNDVRRKRWVMSA